MADDAFDTDPRLERMLADARREEEDRQQRARQRNANRNNFLENYQWAKYIVYIWAFRLSFTLLAGVIPMGIGLYRGFFDTSQDIIYTAELPVYTWRHLLKDDFMLFTNQSFRMQPALIQHVPVLSEDSLHTLLEVLASKVPAIPVKVQHNVSDFAYFDADRLWSDRFASRRSYQMISHTALPRHVQCIHPFLQSLLSSAPTSLHEDDHHSHSGSSSPSAPSACTADSLSTVPVDSSATSSSSGPRDYVYLAYPHMSKWLESFAPSVALLSETAKLPPAQTNLWLSSPDVYAQMHYDLQDNILLQLAGFKTVTVVSPEAMPVVRSYTSLHPLWRQSSRSREALTPRALYDAWQQQPPGTTGPSTATPAAVEVEVEVEVVPRVSSLYNVSTAMIWQVTLAPGDMLYLPAGFFHSVVSSSPSSSSSTSSTSPSSEDDSAVVVPPIAAGETLSLNTWYPSRVNELFHRLQRIALPFQISDPTSVKVAKVMAIMTVVCQLWEAHNRDCLLDELAFRLPAALGNDDEEPPQPLETTSCAASEPQPPSQPPSQPPLPPQPLSRQEFCTEAALQVAEYNVGTTRTANEIAAVTARSKLSMPLQVLAVAEFVEETLVAIFSASSPSSVPLTPRLYRTLLQTCRTQRPRHHRRRTTTTP